ncbi:MAG: endonuclease/exonuclease/phosphatase family protein [Flavobacteriales bacterium]|nr:endonuclease/exonuclease/phosphatase family protein [Flavobacteriales bacterium]
MARSLAAASLLMRTVFGDAQSTTILMDGRFEDWSSGLASYTDNNAPSTGIDLLSMQVTNDDAYLFIKLTVGSEVDLQDDLVPQTIRLYIDGDNNPATGTAVQTGYGAEVQVKFDTRTVTEYFGASSNVSWSTLDLVPLPTTTSNTFEIAIARNALPDGSNALFGSNTIKLLFRETDGGDAIPNAGSVFSYTFDGTPTVQSAPITVGRADAAQLRITAWNVLGDGITNTSLQGPYQRILSALAPDVIGFSECVSATAAQVKTRMDTWLPIGGTGWYTAKDDYDMVIASRWPITQTWPSLTRQYAALIDLPSSYATDLLFTAAHLNCCTADAARQNQADEYVRFVQDAKNAGGAFTLPANTPMVYAGDLNSVGYVQQMSTLLTGDIVNNATYGADGPMDWDGSAASPTELEQTDARMAYTWRSNTSAYPSGRLDHLLYTDAAIELTKSFTLRTEVMPTATLSALGLNAMDASTASDHFPITADFIVPQANVRVSVRCLLEGPFDANAGLMHDSLRVKGLLPLTEPYTGLGFTQVNGGGGESVAPAVLSTTGNNAIVDWVLLELRDKNNAANVLATRCALIQRDGDVVDLDGVSPVSFTRTSDQYFVAVRHRNHLGAMTASALALSNAPVTIDLASPVTGTYGTNATKPLNAVQALWCGNTVRDGVLKYTGTSNDRDAILVVVGGSTPNNTTTGYSATDVNMDGTIKYTGAGNDRDPMLVNVGSTTPNNTRAEQLP